MGTWNLSDLWKLWELWELSDWVMLAFACALVFHILVILLFLSRPLLERKVEMQSLDKLLKGILLYSLFLLPVIAAMSLFFQTYQGVWLPEGDDIYGYGTAIGNLSVSTGTGYGNHWIFCLIFAIWLFGAVHFGLRDFLKASFLLKKLERSQNLAPGVELEERIAGLRRELGVKGHVKLVISSVVFKPFVTGFWRPRLFFPVREMTSLDRELVLRHELIHCRSRDYVYRRLMFLACALFWYSPLICRFADYFAEVNEMACDEKVLEGVSDRERYGYAALLVGFGEEGFDLPNLVSLTGCKESGLVRRIERISKKRGKTGSRLRTVLAAAACVCCPLISALVSSGISRAQAAFVAAAVREEDAASYQILYKEPDSRKAPIYDLSEGDVVHIHLTGYGAAEQFRAGYEDSSKDRVYVTSDGGAIGCSLTIPRDGVYRFFIESAATDTEGIFGRIRI